MGRIITVVDMLTELGIETPSDSETRIIDASIVKAEGAIKRYLKYDPVQDTRTEYYPQMIFNRANNQAVWEVDDNEAYLRYLSSSSTNELQVQHVPIRSITSLSIDYDGRSGTRPDSFGSDTEKVEGTDFWPNYDGIDSDDASICRDGIIRSEGRWPDIAGSVKIVYIAGYTDDEFRGVDDVIDASPIWDATIDEAVRRVHKSFSRMKSASLGFGGGALSEERLGDYSYKRDTKILESLVGTGWDILPETAMKLQDFIRADQGVL